MRQRRVQLHHQLFLRGPEPFIEGEQAQEMGKHHSPAGLVPGRPREGTANGVPRIEQYVSPGLLVGWLSLVVCSL